MWMNVWKSFKITVIGGFTLTKHDFVSLDAIMRMTAPEENTDHYTVQVFECQFCKNGAFTLKKAKGSSQGRQMRNRRENPAPSNVLSGGKNKGTDKICDDYRNQDQRVICQMQ